MAYRSLCISVTHKYLGSYKRKKPHGVQAAKGKFAVGAIAGSHKLAHSGKAQVGYALPLLRVE